MTTIAIHPLTEALWPQLVALFGPQGACYCCWCSYFRLAPKERAAMDGAEKREVLHAATRAPLAPGLIALDGETPVGWVQITPRAAVPRWNTERTASRPLDGDDPADPALWAMSCFFIQSKRRGQGLSHALVEAATVHAARHGARVVEACPMRKAKQSKSIGLFVGSVSVFVKAGFEIVAERKDGRPLMRKVIG
ncbi:acetyltransferase (GNAT) family protein [Hoeflea marina]|uniref:Acetyltransferase (GNAT) family protein n=1 Tax=Hoeflea marina TaxID=274592 RepID=A0A317PUA3_9HYPH|nr:GNAT family N-acetyltransferase [Hoeflea marina]PWW04285.1 acetyltransferase (GNAT) family protein [Hoeflea marina]